MFRLIWVWMAAFLVAALPASALENEDGLPPAGEEMSVEETEIEPNVGNAFGVHLGVNISNADTNTGPESNNYAGFVVGIRLESTLAPGFLYLQPELNFNRLGAENNSFGGFGTTQLNFVEVPLLLKGKIDLDTIRPFFIVGPRLAYLLGASKDAAGVTVARNQVNALELGYYLGAGVELDLTGGMDLQLTARYVGGLTDVDASPSEWRNQGFQLLSAVTF